MRTILLTALCAVVIGTHAKVANDTIDKYIIDKQPIAHFNGSQLEGKCISKYMIAYKKGKGVVERHHVIYTDDVIEKAIREIGNVKGSIASISKKPLILVDGTETSSANFAKIEPEEISHIEVIKDTDLAAKQWGSKGLNGVIIVTTKASSGSQGSGDALIIVDGKEITATRFAKMKAEDIDNVTVFKSGSEAAKSYGNKGRNGVILVITKAGKKNK